MARSSESAVSSVVGTVLMLGITVAVFGGLSVMALSYVQGQGHAARADLAAVAQEESLLFTHKGGESLTAAGGTLYVNRDGYEVAVPITDAGLAPYGKSLATLGLDDGWNLGDTLCVWGQASNCLFDPDNEEILGAFFVADNTLLLQNGVRGLTGEAPKPNLQVELLGQSPAQPAMGQATTWTVRVNNVGAGGMTSSSVLVSIAVDNGVVATATVPGPIGSGASATATSSAWVSTTAGNHALLLTVDLADSIDETNEADNTASSSFMVLNTDPGQPFVDTNGDGVYDPGTDTLVSNADVQDGTFNAGSGSLVIPPSVGPISANAITFTAGGDLTVAVDLTATMQPLTLNAGGDIILDASQLSTLNNNNDMSLTAGGAIQGAGVSMSIDGHLTVTANGPVDFSGANIAVTFANRALSLTGTSVDLDGATLVSMGDLTVTATNGAISAVGAILDAGGVSSLRITSGGGIDITGADLSASTLQACLPTATTPTHKLTLSEATLLDDGNDRIAVRIGGTSCTQSSGTYTNYVVNYATYATRVES